MGIKEWNWKLILKITHTSACLGAIFCGIWAFYKESINFKSILINLYIIAFSIFIIMGEFGLPQVRRLFLFLTTFTGRASTLLFVGSLLFIYSHPQNIVFGIYTLVLIVLDLWVTLAVKPKFVDQEREAASEALRSAGVDAKATVASGVADGVKGAVEDSTPSWAKSIKEDKQPSKAESSAPTHVTSAGASTSVSAPASGMPSWAVGIEEPTARSQVDPGSGSNDPHSNPFR